MKVVRSSLLAVVAATLALACEGRSGDDSDAAIERSDVKEADTYLPDVSSRDQQSSVDAEEGQDATNLRCDDGVRNGDESDIDCGGTCQSCNNFASCVVDADCLSGRCEASLCSSPSGTHEDIVKVVTVEGERPGGKSWADSYSVGTKCYCDTSFDHNIGPVMVDTPKGPMTVREVCEALGPGPGWDSGNEERPLYNDVQCGNGPANDAGDEDTCPGRVDIGRQGCGHIGPRWDLSVL